MLLLFLSLLALCKEPVLAVILQMSEMAFREVVF